MSFSGQIKEELAQVISSPRHCQLAELAALVQFCGHIEEDGSLLVQSENPLVIRKCFTLLKKTFKIEAVAKSQMQTQNYRLFVTGEDVQGIGGIEDLRYGRAFDDETFDRSCSDQKQLLQKSLSARLLYGSGIHERSVQVLSSGARLRLTGAGRAAFKNIA